MSLWMVRAGKYGDQEAIAQEKNVITIGWNELPDLSKVKTKEGLEKIYLETYPDSSKNKAANEIGQIWRFINDIQVDDLIALPLKTQSAIAFGKVKGNYKFEKLAENVKHIRKVDCFKTIARSAIKQDLLYSFGAFMTVCQISRNNAENRIRKLLEEKVPTIEKPETSEITEESIDLEQYARDQIINFIGRNFKGHNLARLVDAVLVAQNYNTKVSNPGPDGGVDILAAPGSLGFDHPRICVQVKSTSSKVDVRIFRELQGVMTRVKAEQGLLVSWGGFTNEVFKEARDAHFSIRLWDAEDLLNNIFRYYDLFDDELKSELSLKKVWSLIPK